MTDAPSDRPALTIPARLHPPIDVSRVKKEKGVKDIVKALLNAHGWFCWMPAANGYGAQGVSDFAAIKEGVFLVVETKFGYAKPSALQKAFSAQIMTNDGFAFCVNERNIDHLAWWLESFEIAKQCEMRKQEVPVEHGSRMLNAISVLTDAFAEEG
jgi:hypothetical protein